MIQTSDLYRLLKTIEACAFGSEALRAENPGALSAWDDAVALRQIAALARSAVGLVEIERANQAHGAAVVATINQAEQSSVTIETMANGAPKVMVTVNGAVPTQAAAWAMSLYRDVVGSFPLSSEEGG